MEFQRNALNLCSSLHANARDMKQTHTWMAYLWSPGTELNRVFLFTLLPAFVDSEVEIFHWNLKWSLRLPGCKYCIVPQMIYWFVWASTLIVMTRQEQLADESPIMIIFLYPFFRFLSNFQRLKEQQCAKPRTQYWQELRCTNSASLSFQSKYIYNQV